MSEQEDVPQPSLPAGAVINIQGWIDGEEEGARAFGERLMAFTHEYKKANWTPIGAAWPNKDGEGFSIQCDAVPLQGRIVMRRITERPSVAGGQ